MTGIPKSTAAAQQAAGLADLADSPPEWPERVSEALTLQYKDSAAALHARDIGPFGVVVKARPNDADREVFGVLRQRLHCLRAYVGIETDADQGLVTLQRRLASRQNHAAIEVLFEPLQLG